MDAQGYPKSSLGVVSGGSWGSPGALLSAPGLLWGTFWGAWGDHLERLTESGCQSRWQLRMVIRRMKELMFIS